MNNFLKNDILLLQFVIFLGIITESGFLKAVWRSSEVAKRDGL